MFFSFGNLTDSSPIFAYIANMFGQINNSFREQDIFYGLNSTVILFYRPNQTPKGPIQVIFDNGSGSHRNIVQESLQLNGFPAVGTNLNVFDTISLIDPRFTEQTILIEEDYAIGIFYLPGFTPPDFLLSKNNLAASTTVRTISPTVAAISKSSEVVTFRSTVPLFAAPTTSQHSGSSMTKTPTAIASQSITATLGLASHTPAILGLGTQDGTTGSGFEGANNQPNHTPDSVVMADGVLNGASSFHYPPHNNGGDLGTIYAGILGSFSVIGFAYLAWRYYRKHLDKKQMERATNMAVYGKEVSDSRTGSLYRYKIDAAKKAYQAAIMMDSGTQTDEIHDPHCLLKSQNGDGQTPNNWPPSPYHCSTSLTSQSSSIHRLPVCEKETVRYSPPCEYPDSLQLPPPLRAATRTTNRMTRWESFESPDGPRVKIYDLKGFM
jgi:hypothetical protein